MRILVVNSFFPPWRGGAETYVYNLSRHLRRRRHEVSVLCGSSPFKAGTQFLDGVRIERLRVSGRVYGTPVMPELLPRLAREETDIIHANFPSPYIVSLTSATSKFRRIPALLTWHNDLPPVTSTARILVLLHDRLVVPLYLPQFRFIVATSRLYAETSPILSAQESRVVVIPNGVDTERFNPNVRPDEICSRHRLVESKVVLFVGALTRWHRYKGLDVLIAAMAFLKNQVPQTKLIVVGGGELRMEYRELAHKLGLGNRVIFAGNVADDELPEYYASSDILVLPSKDRSEGFGLTILEANATGKPAIGTTVGGIPSVIRNGYNGLLVPPDDPQALAQAMKRVLTDEDLLEDMGKNGRTFAEQHDWLMVAEQTESLYRRALAHGPAS